MSGTESDGSGNSGEKVIPQACGRLENSSERTWEPNWHWRVSVILIGRENTILMKSKSFNVGKNFEVIPSYFFIL